MGEFGSLRSINTLVSQNFLAISAKAAISTLPAISKIHGSLRTARYFRQQQILEVSTVSTFVVTSALLGKVDSLGISSKFVSFGKYDNLGNQDKLCIFSNLKMLGNSGNPEKIGYFSNLQFPVFSSISAITVKSVFSVSSAVSDISALLSMTALPTKASILKKPAFFAI